MLFIFRHLFLVKTHMLASSLYKISISFVSINFFPYFQSGRLPLHWAVSQGHEEITDYLLDLGTSVDARDQVSRIFFLQCEKKNKCKEIDLSFVNLIKEISTKRKRLENHSSTMFEFLFWDADK